MIMALFLSLCLLSAGYLIPSLKIDAIHIEEYEYADIIYQIVLSFLLFSSALNMDFKKLAKHKKAVLVLATVGVHYFYGSHWNLSLFYAGLDRRRIEFFILLGLWCVDLSNRPHCYHRIHSPF